MSAHGGLSQIGPASHLSYPEARADDVGGTGSVTEARREGWSDASITPALADLLVVLALTTGACSGSSPAQGTQTSSSTTATVPAVTPPPSPSPSASTDSYGGREGGVCRTTENVVDAVYPSRVAQHARTELKGSRIWRSRSTLLANRARQSYQQRGSQVRPALA